MQNQVLILDFGSQYTQLIARRVRELNIYSEIKPFNNPPEDLSPYQAIILSGSPYSVRADDAPEPNLSEIKGKKPLLGICYGAQYLASSGGGNVAPSATREYGRAHLGNFKKNELFLKDISENTQVWMSHSDTIKKLPENGVLLASTEDVENAAYRIEGEDTFGISVPPRSVSHQRRLPIIKKFLG